MGKGDVTMEGGPEICNIYGFEDGGKGIASRAQNNKYASLLGLP